MHFLHLLQLPGLPGDVRPANASLRLFGGAAFERCLQELALAAKAAKFPTGELSRPQSLSLVVDVVLS
jgi:hypothetical protein